MIKLYEPSPTPASSWPMSRIWGAEFLLCHCFWLITRLQQSVTCSARTRIKASRIAVPTRLQRLGSNVYEVNPWLWQFGLGTPRLGGLTIEETTERKDAASNAWHKRAAATVRHLKANPA